MNIPKADLRFEYMRGTGPGGQHKNKTASACRVTHVPTGLTAYCDERSQKSSKAQALAQLQQRLLDAAQEVRDTRKKARRDKAIHETRIIRTYNFDRGTVKDHRSKKTASIKQVLVKGNIDLLRPEA